MIATSFFKPSKSFSLSFVLEIFLIAMMMEASFLFSAKNTLPKEPDPNLSLIEYYSLRSSTFWVDSTYSTVAALASSGFYPGFGADLSPAFVFVVVV